MTDLPAFVRARLDEDEQAARKAASRDQGGASWRLEGAAIRAGDGAPVARHTWADEGAHIARQDPARTLREVEAKRALLAQYGAAVAAREEASTMLQKTRASGWDPIMAELEEASAIHKRDALLGVLRLLAAVYADHPDYLPEWRP